MNMHICPKDDTIRWHHENPASSIMRPLPIQLNEIMIEAAFQEQLPQHTLIFIILRHNISYLVQPSDRNSCRYMLHFLVLQVRRRFSTWQYKKYNQSTCDVRNLASRYLFLKKNLKNRFCARMRPQVMARASGYRQNCKFSCSAVSTSPHNARGSKPQNVSLTHGHEISCEKKLIGVKQELFRRAPLVSL